MEKVRYIWVATIALLMMACSKEGTERQNFDFGQTVRNEDYMEEIPLKGVGEARIERVDNLPGWISGIMLKEESFQGDPVAVVGVKGDINLEESRSAKIVLKMSTGISVNLELTQWPVLKGGDNDVYKSKNTAFEADWAGTEMIRLVTSNEYENGRPVVKTIDVPLPWAWDKSPICYLPKGDNRDITTEVYKMIDNKTDWALVFNLTGIDNLPGRNYFGLYNRYTGTLRVFYYLTQDLVPTNNASDHLWSFTLNSSLAEHLSAQFTIPRKEKAEGAYLARVSRPYLTSPTTDVYNPLSGSTSNVLATGWWAFDVGMAAYRDHSFFGQPLLNAASIQLCTFNEEKVLLNSVIKGNLNGELSGSVNLDLLRPTKANGWAVFGSQLLGSAATLFTNTYWLNEVCGKRNAPIDLGDVGANNNNNGNVAPEAPNNIAPRVFGQTKGIAVGIVSILVGSAISIAAKYLAGAGSQAVVDENFGALNATANLDLNAVMATQGSIGAPTPNLVPPVSMSMEYLREKDSNGNYTCLGEGVWNVEKHPVIYVVKDAYWYENKFTVLSTQKEFPVGENSQNPSDVYSYYLGATKGSRPGLRLITFFDPTSIEGVSMNPKLFNDELESIRVYQSYGVYPGSAPGYTDSFRKDADMDYPHSWRLHFVQDKGGKYLLDSLNLVRKIHTDEIFKWAGAPEGTEAVVGRRLSSQKMRADHPGLERRFFGPSIYYNNPYASEFVVDEVQYVYDPQVYLPFDEAGRRIYDPVVPDFVVTVTVTAFGKDKQDKEICMLNSTLRFLPKVELISYKDVPAIYNKINKAKGEMSGPIPEKTTFKEVGTMVDHIGDIEKALQVLK